MMMVLFNTVPRADIDAAQYRQAAERMYSRSILRVWRSCGI